jgi:hypothetical protein
MNFRTRSRETQFLAIKPKNDLNYHNRLIPSVTSSDHTHVLAFDTLIKHRLPFISRSQLHGVEVHFGMLAFGTCLLDHCSCHVGVQDLRQILDQIIVPFGSGSGSAEDHSFQICTQPDMARGNKLSDEHHRIGKKSMGGKKERKLHKSTSTHTHTHTNTHTHTHKHTHTRARP